MSNIFQTKNYGIIQPSSTPTSYAYYRADKGILLFKILSSEQDFAGRYTTELLENTTGAYTSYPKGEIHSYSIGNPNNCTLKFCQLVDVPPITKEDIINQMQFK